MGKLNGLGVILLLLCAACAQWVGPRTVEVSQARLEQLVSAQFPLRIVWRDLIEISASSPRLTLLPESNRLAIELDLAADERLSGRAYLGVLTIESGLRYEPRDRTLRLAQPSVQQIAFDGLPPALQPELARLGRRLASQWLADRIIYTLREQDGAKLAAAGVQPGAVRVTAQGVVLEFEPLR